ncbi:hypothetical protein OROHE_004921 [Orobanche hederae]
MFDGSPEVPEWVSGLMSEKFFNACVNHEDARRNEKNIFCLDCCVGICPHCVTHHHRCHRLLQIRRYVYHDVVRLEDAVKLMDCAHIQCYTNNSAKVVFLNQRPQSSRHNRTVPNFCINCHRNLQPSYLFCSLSCKIQHILRTGCKLSKYLRDCEFLTLSEPGSYDGQMTPDSVLEHAGSVRTDSDLSESPPLICTATTEVVRKKRSNLTGLRPACGPAYRPVSEINRRKGTPHRSPLY